MIIFKIPYIFKCHIGSHDGRYIRPHCKIHLFELCWWSSPFKRPKFLWPHSPLSPVKRQVLKLNHAEDITAATPTLQHTYFMWILNIFRCVKSAKVSKLLNESLVLNVSTVSIVFKYSKYKSVKKKATSAIKSVKWIKGVKSDQI